MKKKIIIAGALSLVILAIIYYPLFYKSPQVHGSKAIPAYTIEAHDHVIWAVKFSPSNKIFASGSVDSTIKLWDKETGQLLKTIKLPSGITCLVFSADGKYIACSAYDGVVRLLDTEKGIVIKNFTGHQGTVWRVAFSPDEQTIASAGEDKLIRLWSVSSGKLITTFKGHQLNIWCLDFSPDGSLLASGSFDATVKIWNMHTQQLVHTIIDHSEAVVDLAFSHNGKMLASVSDDQSTRLWNTSSWQMIRRVNVPEHVQAVAFSNDDQLLLTGGRDKPMIGEFLQNFFGDSKYNKGVSARLWNTNTGELLQTFSSHSNDVNDVAFSPDDKYLATASLDQTLEVWKMK